jgi:hypothetical protein
LWVNEGIFQFLRKRNWKVLIAPLAVVLFLQLYGINRLATIHHELEIAKQAMQYQWRILHKRYLGMSREKAYRQLISRLSSVVAVRNKIQMWISLSRDCQRSEARCSRQAGPDHCQDERPGG